MPDKKYKEATKRYNASPLARAAQARFYGSEKYKISRKKSVEKRAQLVKEKKDQKLAEVQNKTTSVCSKCKIEKSLDCFGYKRDKLNGRASQCKACNRAVYHTEHGRDVVAKYHKTEQYNLLKKAASRRTVFKRHNITEEYFNALVTQQDNKCGICQTELQPGYQTHIDHNHTTSKVRGLLCSKCNTGLGLFNENKQVLLNAISYLDNTE